MWRIIEKHAAVSEEGERHTIVGMSNGLERDWILQDGRALVRQADGTFKVEETGQTLRIVVT